MGQSVTKQNNTKVESPILQNIEPQSLPLPQLHTFSFTNESYGSYFSILPKEVLQIVSFKKEILLTFLKILQFATQGSIVALNRTSKGFYMVTNGDQIWKKFYDERGSSILIDNQQTLTHIVNQGYESIQVITESLSKHCSRISLTVH
jgi:hypothetical protein